MLLPNVVQQDYSTRSITNQPPSSLCLTLFQRKPAPFDSFLSPLNTHNYSRLPIYTLLSYLTLSFKGDQPTDMFVAPLWRRLLTLVVVAYYTRAQQTIIYDQTHNYTTIVGTWSSGSMNVRTGPVRCLFCGHVRSRDDSLSAGICQPSKSVIYIPQDYWHILFFVSSRVCSAPFWKY
jgi:hypothetical protein